MSAWLAALLLAGSAAAATAPSTAPAAATGGTAPEWLRVYALAPYREIWSLSVEVRDMKKDLPRIIKALEKRGAKPSIPLANTAASAAEGTQQLSYRSTIAQAEAALKDLKKLAAVRPPSIRQGEKLPLAEIKGKIRLLSQDKKDYADELKKMPAISALVETVLAHLTSAEHAAEHDSGEAILNISLSQKAAPAKKP